MPRSSLHLALALALLAGCGDDGAAPDSGDGAIDRDGDVGTDGAPPDGGPTAVPAMAALPVLTPCAPGWSEVPGDTERPAYCAPFGDSGLADCPPTEAHYPGTPGCAPVTTECPGDGWPTDVPEAAVVYVRGEALADGDGSRGAPYRTIAEALVGLTDGAAIALAPGRYGPALVDRDVALRGACGEVVFSSTDTSPALTVTGATVTIDNLRISGGGSREGLRATDSSVHASRLVVDGLSGVGVELTNSTVDLTRARFSDIAETALYVLSGTRLTGAELAFTGTMMAALRSVNSETTVADVVFAIEGTEPELFGAERGGATTFERLAVVGDGTMLLFGGPTLTIRDASIVGRPSSANSNAIVAFGGSRVTLERTSIRRIWSVAAAAADPDSALVAADVVIRADAAGAVRHGVEVGEGAAATLSRLFVDGVESIAVLATDEGTTVIATDLVVRETQPSAGGMLGRALQIQRGARVTVDRVHLVDNHEVAVVAAALGATLELRDAVIARTHERGCAAAGCPGAGIGLGAYLGGHITMTRFVVSENALAGVQLAMDGEIDLAHGVINGNPVGVNVQLTGFDLNRLTDDVTFRDNGINLDSTELPVPAPTTRL